MASMLPKDDEGLKSEFISGVPWGCVLYTWQQRAPIGQEIELGKTGNWRKGLRVADHRRVATAMADGKLVSADHRIVTMKQKGVDYLSKFATLQHYQCYRLSKRCLTVSVLPLLWSCIAVFLVGMPWVWFGVVPCALLARAFPCSLVERGLHMWFEHVFE